MKSTLESLGRLRELGNERIRELSAIASEGIPVVGFFDIFISPELLLSVGAIPVGLRLGGEHEAERAGEKFLKSDGCPFCKAAIGYRYLKDPLYVSVTHLISVTTCDQKRRMAELWNTHFDVPVYVYNIPKRRDSENSRRLFVRETEWIKSEIENLTNTSLRMRDLEENIRKYNRARRMLKELDRFLFTQKPKLTYTEMTEIVHHFAFLDIDVYLSILATILDEVRSRPPVAAQNSVRIALGGSVLAHGDYEIVRILEKRGAHVVGDWIYNLFGTYCDMVEESGDPWANLCEFYRLRSMSAIYRPIERYYVYVKDRIEEIGADAVIYKTLKFCDIYSAETIRMKKEIGLPFLHIDSTYSIEEMGQLETRIEAFLEML